MFFHIDESGNSGNNLFDPLQPVLSYGVLSSRWDVDAHGLGERELMLRQASVQSLHANELGIGGLNRIADTLVALQDRFELSFDYYFVDKQSYAVVNFFNAVCDAGLNEAMKWDWYWTPLRFPLIAALDRIMDDGIRRESWRLCLAPRNRIDREASRIVDLLLAVLERLAASDVDARLREVLTDALRFGARHPLSLDFGVYNPTTLSPNAIGFQFVLTAIAHRQRLHGQKALRLTVDRQTQFNGAQLNTHKFQSTLATAFKGVHSDREGFLAHPFLEGAREDTATLIAHFPERAITISPSVESFGLQITDVYLWLINRYMKGSTVPQQLIPIIESVLLGGMIDGISVDAMMQRWTAFEQKLPSFENVAPEHRETAQRSIDAQRRKVEALNLY
jgi:hypothetical protein